MLETQLGTATECAIAGPSWYFMSEFNQDSVGGRPDNFITLTNDDFGSPTENIPFMDIASLRSVTSQEHDYAISKFQPATGFILPKRPKRNYTRSTGSDIVINLQNTKFNITYLYDLPKAG